MRRNPGKREEWEETGIIEGPFQDCDCPSHHQHGESGAHGCPVCNPSLRDEKT